MNNEPVAWMFQGAFDISTYVSFEKPNPDIYPNPTPLYTHPAKTEDEALKTFYEDRLEAGKRREETLLKTIEALLRKAQEKWHS